MGRISNLNPKKGFDFFVRIKDRFGYKFFYLLLTGNFGTVGIIYYMITGIQFPYYQQAGVDGQTQSEMASISRIPWACKGFVGVISDLFPILGYHKFYYLLFYSLIAFICQIGLALLPFSIVKTTPAIAATLFFGLNWCSAAYDLLLEAKNIELMQRNPAIKGSLVTAAWFFETVGQLIPSISIGLIADATDVRICFYIFLPGILVPLPFVFLGGVIEDTLAPGASNFDRKRFLDQWSLITLTVLQAIITIVSVLVTFFTSPSVQLIFLTVASLILCILAYFLLDRIVANFNLFTYFNYSLFANIQGAVEYYYTADEDCVEDGPKFTYTVVNTYGLTAHTIAQFLAIWIFQSFLTNLRFREVLWISTLLRMVASISDLSIVYKWNRFIGIPDEILFILGYGTFAQLCYVIDSLTTVYLMAKLSPKKYEATMFAFLAGLYHFGGTTSYNIGIWLMENLGLVTIPDLVNGIECNYNNLGLLIIIAHIILPALTIPMAFFLIPGIRLKDQIRHDYEDKPSNTKTLQIIDQDNTPKIS